ARKRAPRGTARAAASASRFGGALLALLAHDRHRDFQRLLVVEPRIDRGAVGALQVRVLQLARAAGAPGDVLAGQLQVHAAQAGAGGGVQVAALFAVAEDVGEAAGLVAVAGALGVAVHGGAHPRHATAVALDRVQ